MTGLYPGSSVVGLRPDVQNAGIAVIETKHFELFPAAANHLITPPHEQISDYYSQKS